MAEGNEGEEEEDDDDDNKVEEEEQSNGAKPEAGPEVEPEAEPESEPEAAAAVGRGRRGAGKAAAKAADKVKKPTAKKLQALGPTRMLSQDYSNPGPTPALRTSPTCSLDAEGEGEGEKPEGTAELEAVPAGMQAELEEALAMATADDEKPAPDAQVVC